VLLNANQINGNVVAGNDVTNYGVINNAELVHAGQDIKNIGGQINLNRATGEVSAIGNLLIDNGGSVNFSNIGLALATAGGALTISNGAILQTTAISGDFYALAGGDVNVTSAGKLIADNSGNATVGAGAIFNAGQANASGVGGDLLIQNGGVIEKHTGTNYLALTAFASREAGAVPNQDSTGGHIIVEGVGSAVNVSHAGDLTVSAEALVPTKFLNSSEQFTDPSNKEQYAFRVSDGGVINKNNRGDMNVTAQTVYVGDSNAIVGTTQGTIDFNSASDSLHRQPRYFKMQEAIMTNVGAVTINEYTLNLDPSGIQSDTAITLNIYNSADIAHPQVLIGQGSMQYAQTSQKNFLDAPSGSIQINGHISANPADNISTVVREVLASALFVNRIDTSQLPETPCDTDNHSTLRVKDGGVYIPNMGVQIPYSVLDVATDAIPLMVAVGQKTPFLTLAMGNSFGCLSRNNHET
jgi:hypothetical protein